MQTETITMKKPSYLIPPCGKSRAAILAWLNSFRSHGWQGDGSWKFCFDVKARMCDFSFENLWRHFLESGAAESTSERWQSEARELLEENEKHLWAWGVEDAQSIFTGGSEGRPDDDAYTTLWNGKVVSTRFAFLGRSGGWLVLTEFDGVKLDAAVELEEMPYSFLRDLAEMVRFVEYTTEGSKPERAIEAAAAFVFFANICCDIASDAEVEEQAACDSRVSTIARQMSLA